jgi:hypothetical protein
MLWTIRICPKSVTRYLQFLGTPNINEADLFQWESFGYPNINVEDLILGGSSWVSLILMQWIYS